MAGPPVLILGGGLTALGVLRLLGRRGIEAYVWPPATDFVRHSRWYRAAPIQPGADGTDPVAVLQAVRLPRAVLVPVSDAWAMTVAALPAALTRRFPASTPRPEVLRRLVDKGEFAGLLEATAVPHPFTVPVATAADLARVPEEVIGRAFLKPRDSQRFFARYGVKAWRVTNRADAAARLATLAADGVEVVCQEYLPGAASDHYFVDGFADRTGRVRAIFARRRLRMYPPDFGNSSCVVSVPRTEVADAVAALERLVAHLGYRGIFSAEFKRDARDGGLKLLEVNARAWWYVEFAGRCGVDVVAQAYDDALGRPVKAVDDYDVGRELIFPYYDYHALRREGRLGPAALARWAERTARAVQPVWSGDDPVPAVAAVARQVAERLRRSRRRRT